MLQIKARLSSIASEARTMGSVMNLDKGLGKDFSDLIQKANEIGRLSDSSLGVLANTYYDKYVEIFDDLTDNILPKVFFRADASFVLNLSNILNNEVSKRLFDTTNQINLKKVNKISLDFMSFLLIKKYQDKLLESNSKSVGSLSNEFIYENGKGEVKLLSLPSLFLPNLNNENCF